MSRKKRRMSTQQKVMAVIGVLIVLAMILPSILPLFK